MKTEKQKNAKIERLQNTLRRRTDKLHALQCKYDSITENLIDHQEIKEKLKKAIILAGYKVSSAEIDLQIEKHRIRFK